MMKHENKDQLMSQGCRIKLRSVLTLVQLDLSISSFQLTSGNCQVISLGAGFDTLYWNLKDAGLAPASFVEVDFPTVTSRKIHFIRRSKALLGKITDEGS